MDAIARPTALRTRARGLSLSNVWAIVVVAVPVGVTFWFRMSVVDLAYHLRAGQAILESHHVPSIDTFTFSVAGQPWLDQQWGAQVVLALVSRTGGWVALAIWQAALVGVTFWLIWLACRARGATARASAGLTLGAYIVSFLNTGMRPQTMAYPLFAASLWILADRRMHPRRVWMLPALMVIWANVHGSFPLGFALMAFAWMEDRRDRAPTRPRMLVVAAVALVATLIGPYGIRVWGYAIGLSTNDRILEHIQEWGPTTVRSLDGVLFFASALAVVAFLVRRGVKIDAVILAWLGSFFVLGLVAARGQVWWALVLPVVVAGLHANPQRTSTASEERGNSTMNLVVVVALIAFVIVGLPWFRNHIDPTKGSSALVRSAPQHLVDAVRRDVPPDARVFVSLRYASWFVYASTNPVYIDPRIELFPEDVWATYDAVIAAREDWREILDRLAVEAVVLEPTDVMIAEAIANDDAWRLAYDDGSGSVFVRA